MVETLNNEAYQLIKLVSYEPKEIQNQNEVLKGSTKERGYIDWSDKIVNISIEKVTNNLGNNIAIYSSYENGNIGFNELEYPKFKSLVEKIYSIENFNKFISLDFIEIEIFNWIINVYKTQKAESSLYNYLLNSIESKIAEFTFYFPILNLEIEVPFIIGNVEFTYFTKEYFDNLYESIKIKDKTVTEENFKKLYRNDFQGQVVAKVTIKAEKNKAEEYAKSEAEISVNILKLYSDSAVVPEMRTMFDLNFRLGYQVQANFLSQKPENIESLTLSMYYNNKPFFFNQRNYQIASESGLKIFSEYILLRKNDELYRIIIQSIHLFGSALSNWDLHLRCVNMITILESIFLKDEENWKMEAKVKKRLAETLSNNAEEKQRITTIISNIYQVRHKMIHKAKRLDINYKELSQGQMFMIEVFLKLIHCNIEFGFTDKEILIDELERISNVAD